ncbi:MAG: hypothetical protein HON47_04990 [Candidatus Diapherotrites archaeon]|uniref:Uncharacterized protein n=1 Tax=Candidatus Iainarchaeum sp. TaxID=3101447 RepID=A0A8T5GFY8_9ARCH|nr:hypothetical protein [Candidatus Diapherotrites archaeon]
MAVNLNRTPRSIGGIKAKNTITRLSDRQGRAHGVNPRLVRELKQRITAAKTQFRLHEEIADYYAEAAKLRQTRSQLKFTKITIKRKGRPSFTREKNSQERARDTTRIDQINGQLSQIRILIKSKKSLLKKVDPKVNPAK